MTESGNEQVSQRQRRKFRKFTVEQRQQIVAESFAAGASVSEVAARHGVRANQLSTWRTESKQKKSAASPSKGVRFAAVHVDRDVVDGVIEIDLSGGCIRVRGQVLPAMLREVLGLMR